MLIRIVSVGVLLKNLMKDSTAESVKPQSVFRKVQRERVTHTEYMKTMG